MDIVKNAFARLTGSGEKTVPNIVIASRPGIIRYPRNDLSNMDPESVKMMKAAEEIYKILAIMETEDFKAKSRDKQRRFYNNKLEYAYKQLGIDAILGRETLKPEQAVSEIRKKFEENLAKISNGTVTINEVDGFSSDYDKAVAKAKADEERLLEEQKKAAEEAHKKELKEKEEEGRKAVAAANADKLAKVAAMKHERDEALAKASARAAPRDEVLPPTPDVPAPEPPADEKKKIDVEKFLQGQRALAMLSHLSMDQLQRFSPETQLAVLNYKWLKTQSRGKKNWPTPVKKAPPRASPREPRETNELTISKRTQRELKK